MDDERPPQYETAIACWTTDTTSHFTQTRKMGELRLVPNIQTTDELH